MTPRGRDDGVGAAPMDPFVTLTAAAASARLSGSDQAFFERERPGPETRPLFATAASSSRSGGS